MADQLAIYNAALAHIGSRRIAAVDEPRESARALNDEWTAAVTGCLQMTAWSFATRTAAIAGTSPGAGPFPLAFPMPADWLRTADISSDGSLSQPLDGYLEEGGKWFATPSPIYVRYVSSDPSFGFAVARWHQPFADLVALALAARVARRLTGSGEYLGEVMKLRGAAAQDALAFEEQTATRQYPALQGPGETRLAIYNAALAHLGRARTPSLTSANETVRALNDQWRDAVRYCLQSAAWGFAATYAGLSPTGATLIGLQTFAKPADWLRTTNVAADGDFAVPVSAYVEEGKVWAADVPQLFVRYVSSDPTLGFDLTRWTPRFCDLVALRLAEMSAGRLAPDAKDAIAAVGKARADAQAEAETIEAETIERLTPPGTGSLSRLQVSNDALARLGLPRLPSLTDVSSVTRAVNDQWQEALTWCLQRGAYHFAAQTAGMLQAVVTPRAGFAYAYTKPADHVLSLNVAADAELSQPVAHYVEEGNYIYADAPFVVVRYVSSIQGSDPTRWTPLFRDLLAARLAELCAPRLGAGAAMQALAETRDAAEGALRASERESVARIYPTGGAVLPQIQVCNDALAHLGLPRIGSLTEVSETTRALNDQFPFAALWALQQAPWQFAVADATLAPVDAVPIASLFTAAFAKPADLVQTLDLAVDGQFTQAVTEYADEGGYWFASLPALSVRYVSSDPARGLNTALWQPTFRDLVAWRLAETCAGRLKSAMGLDVLVAGRTAALNAALSYEAENAARTYAPASPEDAVRLEVMNEALGHLGRRRLASLTEIRQDLRCLNQRFETDVRWCLEQGAWSFAIRTAVAAPAGYAPFNGFQNSFIKPDDWVKTVGLSASGDFQRNPLAHWMDGDGIWYTNTQGLAVRYISLDTGWGFAVLRWTPSFRALLALRLAEMVCSQVGGNQRDLVGLIELRQRALKESRANDAMNTSPVFAQPGSWARSRRVWGGSWRQDGPADGGSLPLLPDGRAGASGRLAGATANLAGEDPDDPQVLDDQGNPLVAPGSGGQLYTTATSATGGTSSSGSSGQAGNVQDMPDALSVVRGVPTSFPIVENAPPPPDGNGQPIDLTGSTITAQILANGYTPVTLTVNRTSDTTGQYTVLMSGPQAQAVPDFSVRPRLVVTIIDVQGNGRVYEWPILATDP